MTGQPTSRPPVKPPVAVNLRLAQSQALLSNRALAHALGISERLLGKWRSGEITPSWANILALAEVLEREPSWFYEEHPEASAA